MRCGQRDMKRKQKTRSIAPKILLTSIGVLLILYGASIPLLGAAGRHTTGQITVVRRELGDRRDPIANRYGYSVGYEFTLEDGTVIYGNTKTIGSSFDAGIAKGPAGVVYMESFPYLNMLEQDTRISPAPFIYIALGALLLWVAYSKKVLWNKKKK